MGSCESKNERNYLQHSQEFRKCEPFSKDQYKKYLEEVDRFKRNPMPKKTPEAQKSLVKWKNTLQMMYETESKRLNDLAKACGFEELVDREGENIFGMNKRLGESLESSKSRVKDLEDSLVQIIAKYKETLGNYAQRIQVLEEHILEINKKHRESLKNANVKIETLEEKIEELEAKMPIDPETARQMKNEMAEALKTFKKIDRGDKIDRTDKSQKKTVGEHLDKFLNKMEKSVVEQMEKAVNSSGGRGRSVEKVSEFDKRANLYEYVLTTNIRKIKESPYITVSDLFPVPEQPRCEDFRFHWAFSQKQGGECSICWKEMPQDRKLTSYCASCNHKYHKKCIRLPNQKSEVCPLCRSSNDIVDGK